MADKTLDAYIKLVGRTGGVFLVNNWLCPRCSNVYSGDWLNNTCDCGSRGIGVSLELVDVVILLVKLGLVVSSAHSATYRDRDDDGKITQIDIGFRNNYPLALFYDLPPEWGTYEHPDVVDDVTMGTSSISVCIGLTCLCKHHFTECDDDIIHIDKVISIGNLESWITAKDAIGTRAVLMLNGFEV